MMPQMKPNKGVWILQTIGIVAFLFLVFSSSVVSRSADFNTGVANAKASLHPMRKVAATATNPGPKQSATRSTIPEDDDAIQAPVPGDWTGYSMSAGHTGFNSEEFLINQYTAPGLKRLWTRHAKGAISDQPVEFNGLSYWGSWDGFEHATNSKGKQVWATRIGVTVDYACNPPVAGVASTAAIATIRIGHAYTPMVFVGGGDGQLYALNAMTGKIIWKTLLGHPPAHFLWSSPVIYRGSVYIGMASFGDCPTVQGGLIQLNAANGRIKNVFPVVPAGCRGGAVWSTPAIDTASGNLYISTGNPDPCYTKEYLADSVIELRASDLSFVDAWTVPSSQTVIDSDFGATPSLFSAKIGGRTRAMLGVGHKNGIYYAFNRNAIGNGPVWEDRIAFGGSDPQDGQGVISASAWDGRRLYVAGGGTYISGSFCEGSVRAINPATGSFLWQHCLTHGPVLGNVTAVPGLVVVADGSAMEVIDAANGKRLFAYIDPNLYAFFAGGVSISDGMLYIGSFDGNLYAFGLVAKHVKEVPV